MNSRRNAGRALDRLVGASALLLAICAAPSCVTENLTTGEVVPRGDQKLPFEKVEKNAEKLREGMSPTQVLILLGAPAEKGDNDNVWIYLPERYAILIPARALRLEFKDRVLVDYGYRPIVLGARL
jgi:outer membrane protein assembly factor BamE (lipoprotein component of BamABCDE complex)